MGQCATLVLSEPDLHRDHPRQEVGGGHWAMKGAGDCSEEQQNGAAIFRAAGEAAELEVIDMMATQQSWRMPSIANASCDNL